MPALRRPVESTQYVSIRYTERLAEAGVEPSVGSVGDSYDNALAETINGLYKAEVIHRRGPWRSFEAVEFATLEWSTGSTIAGYWSPSATSRRPKPRNATTPCSKTQPWRRDSNETASCKPGAVHCLAAVAYLAGSPRISRASLGVAGSCPRILISCRALHKLSVSSENTTEQI